MKKAIPVIIAIVLICVVLGVSFGKTILERYSYGHEKADLNAYFDIYSASEVPVILQDTRIEEKGSMKDGHVYFPLSTVKKLFTDRFYYDYNENLLLYTNAVTTVRSEVGSSSYTESGANADFGHVISYEEGGSLFISIDYIKKFVNFSYELFEDPYHMQLYTEWGTKDVAAIKKPTAVRWRAGVKSEILTEVEEGDIVELLEPLDDWMKVKTKDGFIGYLEQKFLKDETTEAETPVTEVAPENFKSLNLNKKINLVWHNMEYVQGASELYAACAKVKSVNVISPTWFWLSDNEGNFDNVASAEYVDAAHAMGMDVWGLVANFHSYTDVNTEAVLTYTSKREHLVSGLVEEALQYKLDGINVDFESVPPSTGDAYIQFIRELSLACHENNLVLSVDNYVPTEYTAFYNRKEQGIFADYVIIMGYDEHYAGSDAGSVSSMPWMVKGIQDTVSVVPKEKVINAIPFYTRVWKTTGGEVSSEAVTMAVAADFLTRNNLTAKWDDATNQNYAEMTSGSTLYQVWMEDMESLKVRLNVIKESGIAGVAEWKLGQEIPEAWDYIEAYMQY